ncbi:hypothetical protein ACFQX7_00990 [Luedemannella flava]
MASVYVAGHQGLLGSAVVRRLRRDGHADLVLHPHTELDLRDQRAVRRCSPATAPGSWWTARPASAG